MFEGKDIVLNRLEKKSFYFFLSLYIVSSSIFICLSAYWYYMAQKSALQSNQYYKLQHIADNVSQHIVQAHMQDYKLKLPIQEDNVFVALIGMNDQVKEGFLVEEFTPTEEGYFTLGDYNVLVSDSPQEHLSIKFVVVQSSFLVTQIEVLENKICIGMILSIIIMSVLALMLSLFFMKPIRQKIKQIEDFVHDTAHELNTPITALSMSVSRAIKKEVYDVNILKNISVSTKQLLDIYKSLSFLSFEPQESSSVSLDICEVLERSVAYYHELAQSKGIKIIVECDSFKFYMDEVKLTMLFGNLINNAIKYSYPDSEIKLRFKGGIFTIEDHGIGIEAEKVSRIFERFNRQTGYSGGFGIGLSIVKKISDEYNLKIIVKSKINNGSCFTVKFLS